MNREQVLVVPTPVFHEAGLFQGISRDVDRYLPRLLARQHLSFMPRAEAEQDPTFKQIIPYVVLRWRDQVFHYRRGQGTTEKRLRALRSIGVGGHINPCDHAPGNHAPGNHASGESPYRLGMLREVEEEVFVETTYRERCVGLINDDATPVGQVHLGIVHVFDLDEPRVRRREADVIHSGFAAVSELLTARHEFETWSQFVLQELADSKCS